ncbi:sensor domain-containing diguanylate cyclase [Nitrogeniibacter mangrovi]|uniref:diguanylate cyclase n=1 Tax=Nitrogeniibacter mangrovi TaxID=2016596 RepID=A0A6C1AZ80_9RHOO|nr:sensor domain-containing diguanylate cyclase [Nitrogeniibacter mangrovi]QID16656.1 sensor domain-containing diguanylate cyclase [Nitrogeniibacter mangrovi]
MIPDGDSTIYKTLLESTKAIPWQIDWKTLRFSYIGPQIESLLGWPQDSWKSVEDWAARIHPDERDSIVNFCVAQSQSGVDHEADYRALTRDGEHVWIRDVVHVVRNPAGEVESLIGFMFDITERKQTEQKLLALQKELESLSFKDGLTGVSNRRMFDSILEAEWVSARRNGQPLSVILIDIDYFKQYNDAYGHVQGDACLRQVAQLLNAAAKRSRDALARFGGEEFALILPETDANSAMTVAERCIHMIFKAQIPHAASPISQLLTASLGVGTIVPAHDDDAVDFLERVDRRLYAAKEGGRNRIVNA